MLPEIGSRRFPRHEKKNFFLSDFALHIYTDLHSLCASCTSHTNPKKHLKSTKKTLDRQLEATAQERSKWRSIVANMQVPPPPTRTMQRPQGYGQQ